MAVTKTTTKMRRFGGFIYLCVGVIIMAVLYYQHSVITTNNSTQGQMEFERKPSNRQTVANDGENHSEHNYYLADVQESHEMDAVSTSDSVTQCETVITGNSEIRPPCNLTAENDTYVMDALERMTTVKCKLEAANLACLHRDGQLYPERLPRNCPAKAPARGEYLGCYSDNAESRILGEHFSDLSDNTPQACMDHCLQHGFSLSGVQYGFECFCGDNSQKRVIRLPESACHMPCSGDTNQICGGDFALSVYRTGISKLPLRKIIETRSTLSDTTRPRVKILYLLTLSGRSVRQVKRLFGALYHSTETYFIIHVDARQDYMFRELLPLEERFPNVRLSRYRRSTIWGGVSLLDVLLHCMEEVLSFVDWNWDYVFNLSESDFPIKPHYEFITFLTANNGSNFMYHRTGDIKGYVELEGLLHTFYECENRMWNIGDRKLPSGIEFDVSSDWFGLTRSFVEYAVHNVSELVVGLKRVHKYTLMSTESFFQTLLANSEFCETSAQTNLHHISWKRDRCGCMHYRVVDWCGCSPSAFTLEDWPEMRETKPYIVFIARKFTPLINQAILNHLDTWVFGVQPGLPGWTSYWENEYHSDSASPPVESAFYTVYESLSRLSLKNLNLITPENINLTINRVLEATLYNDEDIFKGILILFEVVRDVRAEKVLLETQAVPKDFYEVIIVSGPVGRLKSMEVGSHYSEVDHTFRNLGRIFGVHSILSVLHKWNDGESLTVYFVWIDPTDTIAGITEVTIPVGSHTGLEELSISQPMRPGVWTLKLIYDWKTVAQRQFLVVPLSHNGTSPISAQEAEFVNGGLADKIRYTDVNFSHLENQDNAELRLREARQNGKLYGSELLDWIDGLVAKFYYIQDMCYIETSLSSHSQSYILDTVTPCRLVSWSSRSIDSKSVLGIVNKFTGLIER